LQPDVQTADAPRLDRLALVEVARGIAAGIVVLFHCARHIDAAYHVPLLTACFKFGDAGVDLFFVISGFVICFVHLDDLGHPETLRRYVIRRFLRIFPLYWIATLLTLAIDLAAHHSLPSIKVLAISATLYPFSSDPLLGVAWTLKFEVLFYAVFGLTIYNRKLGLEVGTAWLLVVLMNLVFGPVDWLMMVSRAHYSLLFLGGVAAAMWMRRWPDSVPTWILPLGAVLFALVALGDDLGWFTQIMLFDRMMYGPPAMLLVLGLAAKSRRLTAPLPALPLVLGSASYSIYLFQFIFIAIAWQIWQRLPFVSPDSPGPATVMLAFATLALSAIAGGVMVSRTCEYPLLRLLRRRAG